jgi:hypothetical protein
VKLRGDLDNIDDAGTKQTASELIEEADAMAIFAASSRWLRRWSDVVEWWYGGRVEQAWGNLHLAELSVIQHANDHFVNSIALERALSYAETLDPHDPVRLRLERIVRQRPNQAAQY